MPDAGLGAPNAKWWRSDRLFAALLVAGSLLPLWAATQHHTYLNDDTYITLTYAQNLARGRGFVFNHPPATLGTTTPLLTLSVAAIAWALPAVTVHALAVFFTALCWSATAWTIYLFRRSWQLLDWQAGLLGLILLGTGWIGFLGMEVYLFAFLLMLSFSLYFAGMPFLSGLCAGLLFLTRGEGILVWAVLVALSIGSEWSKHKTLELRGLRNALVLTAGCAIPITIWSVYALATFGTVVPNTLFAKRAQGMLEAGRPFLGRLLQEWMPSWGRAFALGRWPFLNLWWLLVAVGLMSAWMRRRRWLALLLWIALYVSGYAILGVSAYWWYQLPILFVAQVFLGLGLIATMEYLLARPWSNLIRFGVAAALAVLVVVSTARPVIQTVVRHQGDPRASGYIALSRWLRENTDASESVAFIEIGYLGYYTDNRIIDLAGLVVPDIVPHVAEGDFAWGFWQYEPDYYVYSPAFDWALASIRSDPRFGAMYQPVAIIEGGDDSEYTIFKRLAPNTN